MGISIYDSLRNDFACFWNHPMEQHRANDRSFRLGLCRFQMERKGFDY